MYMMVTRVQSNQSTVYIEFFEKEPIDSAIQECLASKLQRTECKYILLIVVHTAIL
jgi:hypothetical protein